MEHRLLDSLGHTLAAIDDVIRDDPSGGTPSSATVSSAVSSRVMMGEITVMRVPAWAAAD